jgi:hypothetical protein
MHRRITPAQQQSLADISRHNSIRAREAGSILRDNFPEAVFNQKDINNARQRVRLEALDGYTPTQALTRSFREQGVKHRVLEIDDHVAGLFWTYPWCEEMWLRFPEVLSFDRGSKCTYLREGAFPRVAV